MRRAARIDASKRPVVEALRQAKTEAQKQVEREKRESLRRAFETLWRQLGGPELEQEFKFSARGWESDYFHRASGIVIELEGGTWSGGRHTRGQGFRDDCIKYNTLTYLGYRLFRLTSDMLTQKEAPEHLGPIIELMRKPK